MFICLLLVPPRCQRQATGSSCGSLSSRAEQRKDRRATEQGTTKAWEAEKELILSDLPATKLLIPLT